MSAKEIVIKFFADRGESIQEYFHHNGTFLVETEKMIYILSIYLIGCLGYNVEIESEFELA